MQKPAEASAKLPNGHGVITPAEQKLPRTPCSELLEVEIREMSKMKKEQKGKKGKKRKCILHGRHEDAPMLV